MLRNTTGARESGSLERSERLKAVEPRHVDVQDDDVGVSLARLVDCLPAIGRDACHVELVGQHRGHRVEDSAMVVHEKNSRLHPNVQSHDTRELAAHRAQDTAHQGSSAPETCTYSGEHVGLDWVNSWSRIMRAARALLL